jgi:hypothetical protein
MSSAVVSLARVEVLVVVACVLLVVCGVRLAPCGATDADPTESGMIRCLVVKTADTVAVAEDVAVDGASVSSTGTWGASVALDVPFDVRFRFVGVLIASVALQEA